MTFYVGQKVVCVDDGNHGAYDNGCPIIPYPTCVSKGGVYVVEKVAKHLARGHEVVWLAGVFRRGDGLYQNAPLAAARFRPLQEQGMSILRAILANPKRELEVGE